MKKLLLAVLAGAMAFSVTACSSETSEPADSVAETTAKAVEAAIGDTAKEAKDGGYTIGFSPYTLTNEYFTAVLDGVQAACEELDCELIYFDPQNDPTKQASQIDDMIASGMDALVYIPYDSAGAQTVLQTCRDAGVKVINVEGFWQGIRENTDNPDAFKEIQVVEGQGSTDVSFTVVSDALQAHDEIDVIYAINDTSALGAVQAVEESGKKGSIDILGKDGAPIGKHAIKDGSMVQSSAQRPTYMGYMGVKEAVDLLEGKEITFNTSIESYSITADNIDDYDLDAWDSLD